MNILSIPRDNRNDILNLVTLADLGQIRGVCKELKLLADPRFLEIAEGIQGLDQNPSKPLHKRVIQHVEDLKQSIENLPKEEVPEEIKVIVSKNINSIDEINLMQKFRKARDLCKIQEQLASLIYVQISVVNYSNLDDILQMEEDFSIWLTKNRDALFKARTMFLDKIKLQLQYIPAEIRYRESILNTRNISNLALNGLAVQLMFQYGAHLMHMIPNPDPYIADAVTSIFNSIFGIFF